MAFDGSKEDGELELRYEIPAISEDEVLTQELLIGPNCTETVDPQYMLINTTKMFEAAVDGVTPVNSTIDFDTTTISSSDMYQENSNGTEASISFCVRTLFGITSLYNATSDAFVESAITLHFVKFDIGINLALGFESAQIAIEEEDVIDEEEDVDLVASLSACECEPVGLTCINADAYSQNDILTVCIDAGDQAIISRFKDVNMNQEDSGIRTSIISPDGDISQIATTGSTGNSRAYVSTRLISAFFDNSDGNGPVAMSGTAILGFSQRRRLAVTSANLRSHRSVQEEGQGEFDVTISLAGTEIGDLDGAPGASYDIAAGTSIDLTKSTFIIFVLAIIGLI